MQQSLPAPGEHDSWFCPLGGAGEIGMNLSLYGHDGTWLMVDLGITFGGDRFPDHPVMMADPSFIERQRERLLGLVLTHGHEDHIGAIPYLWRRLQCPVYATPFTAALVRAKCARAGIDPLPLIEVDLGQRFRVGPFDIEYITMTHSIPEPNALLIGTPAGEVLHTGDWKLDERPVIGARYDRQRLTRLRRGRLLAMVCDSTNAVVPGSTGSESDVFEPLSEIARQAGGRVLVTSFASNIARLVTLARVAAASGRRFGVLGRAMEQMIAIARATGYWPDELPALVEARHLGYLPAEELLAACTGSQGEARSALVRIANDSHRDLLLDPGDTVVFSSRLIPGNEKPVHRIEQRLRALKVEVITDRDAGVHVSGHPAQEDLRRLYDWVRPPAVIPVHGTPRHLEANATIALDCHVPRVLRVRNGDLCQLAGPRPEIIGNSGSGRLTLQGDGQLEGVADAQLAAMRAAAC